MLSGVLSCVLGYQSSAGLNTYRKQVVTTHNIAPRVPLTLDPMPDSILLTDILPLGVFGILKRYVAIQ